MRIHLFAPLLCSFQLSSGTLLPNGTCHDPSSYFFEGKCYTPVMSSADIPSMKQVCGMNGHGDLLVITNDDSGELKTREFGFLRSKLAHEGQFRTFTGIKYDQPLATYMDIDGNTVRMPQNFVTSLPSEAGTYFVLFGNSDEIPQIPPHENAEAWFREGPSLVAVNAVTDLRVVCVKDAVQVEDRDTSKCMADEYQFQNKCYSFHYSDRGTGVTKADAWTGCRSRLGFLAEPRSREELDFITQLSAYHGMDLEKSGIGPFLGLSESGRIFTFESSQDSFGESSRLWNLVREAEPNGSHEYCVFLLGLQGKNGFTDVPCTWQLPYVCEHKLSQSPSFAKEQVDRFAQQNLPSGNCKEGGTSFFFEGKCYYPQESEPLVDLSTLDDACASQGLGSLLVITDKGTGALDDRVFQFLRARLASESALETFTGLWSSRAGAPLASAHTNTEAVDLPFLLTPSSEPAVLLFGEETSGHIVVKNSKFNEGVKLVGRSVLDRLRYLCVDEAESLTTPSQIACQPGQYNFQSKCYALKFSEQGTGLNRTSAAEYCINTGGMLAEPRNSEQINFLGALTVYHGITWNRFRQAPFCGVKEDLGEFTFDSDEFSFNDQSIEWWPLVLRGEPNIESEHCVILPVVQDYTEQPGYHLGFTDAPCEWELSFVCEYEETDAPTAAPSVTPTGKPTALPTTKPSSTPSVAPTIQPTRMPTLSHFPVGSCDPNHKSFYFNGKCYYPVTTDDMDLSKLNGICESKELGQLFVVTNKDTGMIDQSVFNFLRARLASERMLDTFTGLTCSSPGSPFQVPLSGFSSPHVPEEILSNSAASVLLGPVAILFGLTGAAVTPPQAMERDFNIGAVPVMLSMMDSMRFLCVDDAVQVELPAQGDCASGQFQFESKCYWFNMSEYGTGLTQPQAAQRCARDDGRLAEPRSKAELDFIIALSRYHGLLLEKVGLGPYLGLRESMEIFVYQSDEEVFDRSSPLWELVRAGEPNVDAEHCVFLLGYGHVSGFTDVMCNWKMPYVCESSLLGGNLMNPSSIRGSESSQENVALAGAIAGGAGFAIFALAGALFVRYRRRAIQEEDQPSFIVSAPKRELPEL